jgi:hypothetical protein
MTPRFLLCLLLTCPLVAVADEPADTETFTFRFAPPDGQRVLVAARMSRERLVDGQLQATDVSDSTTDGVFRKVQDGYELTMRLDEAAMTRNGQPVSDPVTPQLIGLDIVYRIGADGSLQGIRGFDRLEKRVLNAVPAQVAAALAPMVGEAAMVAREQAEWNGRYYDFADGEFAIGDVIDVKAPYMLPNGQSIEYVIRTRIRSYVKCPAGRCVKVEQLYESDAHALAQMVAGMVQAVAGDEAPSVGSVRIAGSLVRVIDPATMRIYSERVQRTLHMPLEIPGRGAVPSMLREQRDYGYTYY